MPLVSYCICVIHFDLVIDIAVYLCLVSVFSVVVSMSCIESASQPLGRAGRSFSQVAQTVALISRFRSRTAQRRHVSFGQCYVEPVARDSTYGNRYWSVLEEENSQFLDDLGYYGKKALRLKTDQHPPNPPVKRSGWAAAKLALRSSISSIDVSQASAGAKKSPTLPVPATAASEKKSPTPVPTPARKKSDAGLNQDEEVSLNIPARFMSPRPSLTATPLVKPQVESAPISLCPIPTIEINNNDSKRVQRQHSSQSGFEWYR